VPAFVIRVWLPDRPGALGSVASRVGAVKADVIGIDIIERGAGRAIDELVIDLPDGDLVDLLLAEIAQVEGVDVENIRPLAGPPPDPAVTALQVAQAVHGAGPGDDSQQAVVDGAIALLGADWAALVDTKGSKVIAAGGADLPAEGWLVAFVQGATTEGAPVDLQELAVAPLSSEGTALVVGRGHSPLRGREQQVLEGLAALL
jgi:hypothetical protein